MNDHTQQDWPYPGSRWWKFDFHTHTPASTDTYWAKKNISLSPEQWLLRYMTAGIDCVAVTDHNNGAWIDKLKMAYEQMLVQSHDDSAPEGFRELTLFPGVEISVQGGFHLLAILKPTANTGDIDTLLGKVDYDGTKGDSNGVTRKGAGEVVNEVLNAGGIPIPAHTDGPKGLLNVKENNSQSTRLDANTIRQVLSENGILAIEVVDRMKPKPVIYQERKLSWSEVLGSDCHNFQGIVLPGSRFTWVKMAKPTFDGLWLALLDGNDISIRRSDDGGDFEPFKTPSHFITGIDIQTARFMGNGNPENLKLSPFYNALIGGRGTGKSTIVQALRLAYRRDRDIKRLSNDSELRRQFERFTKVVKGRDGDGALRESTEIVVNLMRDSVAHRLRWRQDGQGEVVEEYNVDGQWQTSESETINAERFPVRLLSQGQIATMAGDNRQALLDIIDEAAKVEKHHRAFNEAKDEYYSLRAKLRALKGRLTERPELQRKLTDVGRKLEAFTKSHHTDVLKAHQQTMRQRREIEETLKQLRLVPDRIETLTQDLLLDDLPDGTFDITGDADVLEWRLRAERALAETRQKLSDAANTLATKTQAIASDDRLNQWRQRANQAQTDFEKLQAVLEAQGITEPLAFERLIQERQQIQGQINELDQVQHDQERLLADSEIQWQRVSDARNAITQARAEFVRDTLHANDFVKIDVVSFGFDTRIIEHSLRDLLDVQDERFESDILHLENGEPVSGIANDLVQASDRETKLAEIKQKIIGIDNTLGGHFQNYLVRKHSRPEFAEHVRCWYPEDDLRIEYNRGNNNWAQITEGSQGQRSAALLAFLLAFGDEPLVLDQPEDDLDNHLIYDLIVRQIRENKLRRQLIIVTHNPNVVINGDAEMVHALDFRSGQCCVITRGALQESSVREEVCRVMEGGREAFARRWVRLGRNMTNV